MPTNKNLLEFVIDPAGTAITVDVADSNDEYLVTGTDTITVDNTFGSSGVLVEGLTYNWKYRAVAIYGGGVVRFHGIAMTATQALSNYNVEARYDGAAWNVDFIPDLSQNGTIEGVKLADDTVAYEKIQETNAGDVLLGEATGAPDNIQEIPCTAAGRALLDDANAAAQRTTLGLGTIATQAAATVTITGGSITGITDLTVADGGTGSSSAAGARTNLGLADGEYLPVLTGVANVAASTAYTAQYVQIGNRVIVFGKVDIDPTAGAPTATQLRMTLPVASNLAALADLGGTFNCPTISTETGAVYADTVNNEALFEYSAASTANNTFYFTFGYKVI